MDTKVTAVMRDTETTRVARGDEEPGRSLGAFMVFALRPRWITVPWVRSERVVAFVYFEVFRRVDTSIG